MIAACGVHKTIVEENWFAIPWGKGLNAAFMGGFGGVKKFLICALDAGKF